MGLVSVNLPKETKEKIDRLLDKFNCEFDTFLLDVMELKRRLMSIDDNIRAIKCMMEKKEQQNGQK